MESENISSLDGSNSVHIPSSTKSSSGYEVSTNFTSETLRLELREGDSSLNVSSETSTNLSSNSSTQQGAQSQKKKTAAFQITSVVCNEGGDESPDETEDISDILDSSKITSDIEQETPSFSEEYSKSDETNGGLSNAALATAAVIPTNSQYGITALVQQNGSGGLLTSRLPNGITVNVTSGGIALAEPDGVVNSETENLSSRFKIVKIASNKPFKRGRWSCFDFMDTPTTSTSTKNILDTSQSSSSSAIQRGSAAQSSQPPTTIQQLNVSIESTGAQQSTVAYSSQASIPVAYSTTTTPSGNEMLTTQQLSQAVQPPLTSHLPDNHQLLPNQQSQPVLIPQNPVVSSNLEPQSGENIQQEPLHNTQVSSGNINNQSIATNQVQPTVPIPSAVNPQAMLQAMGNQQATADQQIHSTVAPNHGNVLMAHQAAPIQPSVISTSQNQEHSPVGLSTHHNLPNQDTVHQPQAVSHQHQMSPQAAAIPASTPVLASSVLPAPASVAADAISNAVISSIISSTLKEGISFPPTAELSANQDMESSEPVESLHQDGNQPFVVPVPRPNTLGLQNATNVVSASQQAPVMSPPQYDAFTSYNMVLSPSEEVARTSFGGFDPVIFPLQPCVMYDERSNSFKRFKSFDSTPYSGTHLRDSSPVSFYSTRPGTRENTPVGDALTTREITPRPSVLLRRTSPARMVRGPNGSTFIISPVNSAALSFAEEEEDDPEIVYLAPSIASTAIPQDATAELPVLPSPREEKVKDINVASTSSASSVAIDGKIEQAMDLVKSHLMFAVREEVDILKENIKELNKRINTLEYENTVLKQYASEETMSHLQSHRQ